MRRGPVGEEPFGVRMEWDVSVVVEFPDRDPQPRRRVQCDDRIRGEVAEFPDAHPGPGEQLDDEPIERLRDRGLRGEAGGLRIVQEPWQRVIRDRDINREDRGAGRRVGPVPFDDPIEELRSIPSRCRTVFRAGGTPLTVRCAAKNALKPST